MEQHPLTNEKTLEKWLTIFSCNGCKYFINKKCTHEKSEQFESEKDWLRNHSLNQGTEFSINWANDIDNHFSCDSWEEIVNNNKKQ